MQWPKEKGHNMISIQILNVFYIKYYYLIIEL
jgi:hypothetical protein